MRKPVLDHSGIIPVHWIVTGSGRWPRLLPGERRTDTLTWRYRDGSFAGSISHRVEIDAEDAGRLTLNFKLNGQPVQQVFDLVGRPCRFGGYRWLARCPRSGRLVAKLYGCAGTFQPRHALDASYRSQDRVPTTEKLRDREVSVLRRLGADDRDQGDPPKPKWMRWPTYRRLLTELRACRYRYGIAMARDLYLLTGLDLSEGELPEIGGR